MENQGVIYLNHRLTNRRTVLEFDKTMAGPIIDQQGLEQGGVSSSDCYKLYSNELFENVQESNLGVDMGGAVISCVGQADDAVLLSNDIQKLYHILSICLSYCSKYQVQLSSSKTKLLKILPSNSTEYTPLKSGKSWVPYNPININGEAIAVDEEAEHVGVIRASNGNMTNIVNRISAFKKAMGAVMACGLARGRRSNPVASLRIITLYGTPVLMSGLASLVMSAKEVSAVDQQLKRAIQNAIKLPNSSPTSLVYFVSGTLPGTAILHLKQLTLFGMVCRLPEDPLHQLACHVLLTSSSPSSWFVVVMNLLMQYQLPHPLLLLKDPPD